MTLAKRSFRAVRQRVPAVSRLYESVRIARDRRSLRNDVRELIARNKPVKLVIGSHNIQFTGWLITDREVLDALIPEDWESAFPPRSIDRILAEHVFEHLTADQLRAFLRIVRPYMAPDGFVRVAVPDGFHPDPAYIEKVRPGGSGRGADDHKLLYDYRQMTALLTAEAYAYRLVEYFDEDGSFHKSEWHPDDGMIRRSADHDVRNQEKPLVYTSLIVDFWPAGEK